jgi:translation initiation factor 2 subunit 1
MFLKKQGYPEESEIVLCKVTSIQHSSVFARLMEYDHSGMIHISEISPGRIRNIREYVKEGKVIVCKVLKVNKERGHIDLSLRRVAEGQRRKKADEIKQEQKAEKIIENLAQQLKQPAETVYKEIAIPVLKEFDYVHQSFDEVVSNNLDLEKLGIKKDIAQKLTKLVKEKLKPKDVQKEGTITITTYAENGVEIIKKALQKAQKPNTDVRYLGSGKYRIQVTEKDYKEADRQLKELADQIIHDIEQNKGEAKFTPKE